MKLRTTISKNLKLLFRSKESAYTIVFGPILIILLVSFAFLGASNKYEIKVGTYAPMQTKYSERAIDAFNQKHYLVSVYNDEDECVQSVKTSTNNACIVFSEKEAGNGSVPLILYLDLGRANIAYQIADALSEALDLQADTIRTQLATDALTRMKTAAVLLDRDVNATQRVSDRSNTILVELQTARQALDSLSNVSINASQEYELKGYMNGVAQDTKTVVNISENAIGQARTMLSKLEAECADCTEAEHESVAKLRKDMDDAITKMEIIAQDVTKRKLFEANIILDETIDDLRILQAQLDNDSIARETIRLNTANSTTNAEKNAKDIAQVVVSLQYTKEFLNSQTVNATSISSPVTTSVVSVTPEENQLAFTYPYLLTLVIMFIGMLLASILVVSDKISKAAFRNFTTPTPDSYQISVSFVTAVLLLLFEVAVILLASTFFVSQPLLQNAASTFSIIIVATILFTFIGMIIGYLSRTQEAAMIAAISVGSILLFVSNLIIPIEGMTALVQSLTRFNPYLVLSELLRQSMLYGVTLGQVSDKLFLVIIMALVLWGITVLIQRRIKSRYFRQEEGLLATAIPAPLVIGTQHIHDEVELLESLDHMTRAEFETVVATEDNVIAQWVGKELRNKALSRKMRTTSKERMMIALDKHLRRHGKDIKKD